MLALVSCGKETPPEPAMVGGHGAPMESMPGVHMESPMTVQDFFLENDRVAIIGNGLADRLQHDGWPGIPKHRCRRWRGSG